MKAGAPGSCLYCSLSSASPSLPLRTRASSGEQLLARLFQRNLGEKVPHHGLVLESFQAGSEQIHQPHRLPYPRPGHAAGNAPGRACGWSRLSSSQ